MVLNQFMFQEDTHILEKLVIQAHALHLKALAVNSKFLTSQILPLLLMLAVLIQDQVPELTECTQSSFQEDMHILEKLVVHQEHVLHLTKPIVSL